MLRSSEKFALAFDVGGTHLRAAVYAHPSGELFGLQTRLTPNFLRFSGESPDQIRRRLLIEMAALGRELFGDVAPQTVAVSFAGPLDAQHRVMAAPTIWGQRPEAPVDLLTELQDLWPKSSIVLENDVSAAGYRFLRSADDDLCVVTVSSGIGNKVFIHGRPMVGPAGRGGEIGHVRVEDSLTAPRCNCGGQGHLGAVSSGRGTLDFAKRRAIAHPDEFATSRLAMLVSGDAQQITNPDIVTAFHEGDPWTIDVIRQTARPLARVLATIHLAVGIERFILIGGFAMALGKGYRRLLSELAHGLTWDMGQDWFEMLELGDLDGQSTLIGMGRRAFDFTEETRHDDHGQGLGSRDFRSALQLRGPVRRRVA
jgi:C7-cyclitol 7-kinase